MNAEAVNGATASPLADGAWSRRRSFVVPAIALVWCAWTMLAVELWGGPVRGISVLLFLVMVPGLAVSGWLEVDDLVFEATLVVGIGAAVGVAVGLVQVWTDWWSPVVALRLLALACALSLGAQVLARLRPNADVEPEP